MKTFTIEVDTRTAKGKNFVNLINEMEKEGFLKIVKSRLYQEIEESLKDVKAGRVRPFNELFKTIDVVKATYVDGYKVNIEFSDKKTQIVDFEQFLLKNHHPLNEKYKDIHFFKKFKIESGNIVWGKNWNLIFPVDQLYKGRIKV